MKRLFLLPLLLFLAASAHGQMLQTITLGGGVPLALNPGWTFLQDVSDFGCSAGNAGCSIANFYPTTAGSVWIIFVSFGNTSAEHITSVTSSSGSWSLCPASACNAFSATHGGVDAIVNFTGTAGTTSSNVNLSAAATGFFYAEFIELLPPAGYTASLDVSGSATNSSCSTSCNGVPLTLTATDAVIQITNAPQLISPAGPFTWSAPYVADAASNGLALNVSSIAGTPTFGLDPLAGTGSSWIGVVGLAFKTTASTFSVPSPLFTWVNFASSYTLSGGVLNCTPSCPAFTIPSTGASHLLFIQAGDTGGRTISSISDGSNTWVVPSGANTCRITNAIGSLSCAYVLSSVSSVTSLTVTMSGNSTNVGIAYYEVSRASGSFSLDAQGSTTNPSSSNVPGQSLGPSCSGCSNSITGTKDVFFAGAFMVGGPQTFSRYPFPFINKGHNSFGGGQTFILNTADSGMLMNSANASAPFTTGPSGVSIVSNVGFK